MARPVKDQLVLFDEIAAMDARPDPYIGYSTRSLIDCPLPYRTPRKPVPKDAPPGTRGELLPVWIKENGLLTVQVQAGYEADGTQLEIPSGSWPRIHMAWIGQQVILNEAAGEDPCRINLGPSLNGLMDRFGITSKSGGSTGNRRQFLRQLRNLASATIVIHWGDADDPEHKLGGRVPITRSWNVHWGTGKPNSHPTEDSVIMLDPTMADEFLKHGRPVNIEALKILSSSALAIDVYQLATSRFFRLDHPIEIPYDELQAQLGGKPFPVAPPDETRKQAAARRQVISKMKHDFKRDLIGKQTDPEDFGALGDVLAVYHEADIKPTERGLRFFPSPVHVPLRGTHGHRRAAKAASLPKRRTEMLALQAAGSDPLPG